MCSWQRYESRDKESVVGVLEPDHPERICPSDPPTTTTPPSTLPPPLTHNPFKYSNTLRLFQGAIIRAPGLEIASTTSQIYLSGFSQIKQQAEQTDDCLLFSASVPPDTHCLFIWSRFLSHLVDSCPIFPPSAPQLGVFFVTGCGQLAVKLAAAAAASFISALG